MKQAIPMILLLFTLFMIGYLFKENEEHHHMNTNVEADRANFYHPPVPSIEERDAS